MSMSSTRTMASGGYGSQRLAQLVPKRRHELTVVSWRSVRPATRFSSGSVECKWSAKKGGGLELNGSKLVLLIDSEGSFGGPNSKGVIIDLSQEAAKRLNMMRRGRVRVGVEVLATPTNRHGTPPLQSPGELR